MTSNIDEFHLRAFWEVSGNKHMDYSVQFQSMGAFFNKMHTYSSHAHVTFTRGSGFHENIGKLVGAKEIYQGDIMEFPGDFKGSPKRHAIVVFEDGAFKLRELDYGLGGPEYMMFHLCKEFIQNIGAIKILGNVFMDTDILEQFKGGKNSGKA